MSRVACAACAAGRRRSIRRRSAASPPSRFACEDENIAKKRAIAREAVALCNEGDAIIINGGTTTFQMVHYLTARRHAGVHQFLRDRRASLKHSKNQVMLPGGSIYRDQSIILSPFENDVTRNFYARRMFMGAQGVGPLGVMEQDALIIQAEQKLINQADELVLMVDSSKFQRRSSLILCPLDRVSTLITDDAIPDSARAMIENAGIKLIVAGASAADRGKESSSAA